MANEHRSCGTHEELARTTSFRLTRCPCGAVHIQFVKGGVTVQISETQLAELVNVATAAQRKVEVIVESVSRTPSSFPTN
jgi:hypothetical protein